MHHKFIMKMQEKQNDHIVGILYDRVFVCGGIGAVM